MYSICTISKEIENKVIWRPDDLSTPVQDTETSMVPPAHNVNQSRYGVIPTSLKVYEWFDTGKTHQFDESSSALNETRKGRQEGQQTSLSMEEVDKLVKQGRVAVKSNFTLNELES